MDNKYGLGSSKVATKIHKDAESKKCNYCQSLVLRYCPTMEDHQCEKCNLLQNDVPKNYATGRSSDY